MSIRGSRIGDESERGTGDKRLKFSHPQPDFRGQLRQTAQLLITRPRSKDLCFTKQLREFLVGGKLLVGEQLSGSVQSGCFLKWLVIDEEDRLISQPSGSNHSMVTNSSALIFRPSIVIADFPDRPRSDSSANTKKGFFRPPSCTGICSNGERSSAHTVCNEKSKVRMQRIISVSVLLLSACARRNTHPEYFNSNEPVLSTGYSI